MSIGLEGRTLGQYRLTERLGKGGMAEVYKAYQASLDRYVAIKVLHAYFAEEEDFRNRFQREARAVARLRHPNIVQVHDFGVEGDVYYMAMEFLAGGTLKQRLREAEVILPYAEALRIVERVAAALDYAHGRGLYHRDVKPANIMLTEDNQVILTDFGLAKMAEGSQYTRSGLSVGTPEYMAPEQGQGLTVDHRADVYSLGVVLYELLTGRLPYTADTPVAIIFKHIRDPLPLPRTINPELSESLERVVLKALAKSPEDRYQSAGDLATALRRSMADAGQDLPTPPPTPVPDTLVPTSESPSPPLAVPLPTETKPGQRIEQTVKRAVSRVADAETEDDWETIGKKMEDRTKRVAARFAGVEGEEDWEVIGQKIGERFEERAAEHAGKTMVEDKSEGQGRKWFLAGCFTALVLLACCVCGALALGNCSENQRNRPGPLGQPPAPSAPAPAEPTPGEQPRPRYEAFGLSLNYPAGWEERALEDPQGNGVQFMDPAANGIVFYALWVRRTGPIVAAQLERLLDAFKEQALGNEEVELGWYSETEPMSVGGERAVTRRFEGTHRPSGQELRGQVVVCVHGDQLYLILAVAPAQVQDAPMLFQSITDSIRFTP